MATEEKSRDAFDPTKRYAGVGMQLGRVLVDDDWNEAERIRLEDERRNQLDVIGPVGSPDQGFAIANGHLTGGRCDFDIGAGTLYLGGLRLWNPTTASFALQDDWLGQVAGDRPALAVDRADLVYVEAWQQPVTAVEDGELFEVALGGPDTSTRLRTMWRVRVAPGVSGADCPGAWKAVVDGWAAGGAGVVDATGERKVDAALTVDYTTRGNRRSVHAGDRGRLPRRREPDAPRAAGRRDAPDVGLRQRRAAVPRDDRRRSPDHHARHRSPRSGALAQRRADRRDPPVERAADQRREAR